MSYAWKVLIPFALYQIFVNGLVIIYDLPDVFFLVFSGIGAFALAASATYIVRRGEPRKPLQMISVRATASAPPPAPVAAPAEGAAS